MLVLSRKKNEKIVIETSDGLIEIVLCDSRQDKARIGVNAPSNCRIWRDELQPKIAGPAAEIQS
jgi:carbon storage regulator CsrA